MVDLETASVSSNAAILSIGAVWFDFERSLGDKFYGVVDIDSCINEGFDVDRKTIEWWGKQSSEARAVFYSENKKDITSVLKEFSIFIGEKSETVQLWGKGPAFDNAILSNAYSRLNIDKPWLYRNDRCVRTVFDLGGIAGLGVSHSEPGFVRHNALDDAVFQAKEVSRIINSLLLPFHNNL